ncbi:MAG: hypothetical protein P4M09_16960 [Devosia sp.]|nr:hypothetical protein [Devosia sp.]
MGFPLHTVEMPNGFGPQLSDRLLLALGSFSWPAAAAALVTLGAITAGTGFTSLPALAPSGGTPTAGVSPAVPAVARATSLKGVGTATLVAAGTGVAINDTFNLTGGVLAAAGATGNGLATPGVPTKLTVSDIQAVSAAVVTGGTGGTPGAVTLTGTTGTGTKFQATGVINGSGVLTGPLVVTVGGDYTVGPTSLTAEPVTGGSLTGATVSLVMGAKAFSLTTAGGYTVPPAAANALTNVVGTGAGVQATVAFGLGTAIIEDSGNYSVAPSFTVTPTDGNGSGASIAAGTLGGAGDAVLRQIKIGLPMAAANIQVTPAAANDAVCSIRSQVPGNPNGDPPYVSISIAPRLAASTLAAGSANLLVAA